MSSKNLTKICSLFTVHRLLNNGITFVSVIILVAVISLSVWSALVLSDIILKSQSVEKTEQEMEMIKEGLYSFYKDCDQFVKDTNVIATDFADLESQPVADRFEGSADRQSKWDGPYIQDSYDDNGYTQDAWKTNYVYNYTAGDTDCSLTSYGLNRVSGGGDDITITIYADDINEEKTRKTKEELAYINAKKDELETRYTNAGASHPWPPAGFGIDNLFQSYGADTTGLISWWEMDEASWDGVAPDAVDSQGSNDGTAYGGVTTVSTSKLGRCGDFDGTDDYVNCGSNSSLDFGTGDFSIEVWVKDPGTLAAPPIIAKTNDVGSANGWGIIENSGQYRIRIGNGTASVTLYSGAFSHNTWHHLVCLREGDILRIYLDGSLKGSISGASAIDINSNGYDAVIAKVLGYDYFNGSIDEVRIWSRALPSTDVFQEYLRGVYLTDWAYKYDEWETEYAWDLFNDEFYSYGPNRVDNDRVDTDDDDIYQAQ